MKKGWLQGGISGIILVGLLLLLFLYPSSFEYPLSEQPYIPLGNAIFAMAFVAFPLFLDAASRAFSVPSQSAKRLISAGFKVALLLGVLWWPVSYALAGNFSNTFGGHEQFVGSSEASQWFWAYSYAIVFFPILLWLLRVLLAVLNRFQNNNP